VFKRDDRLVRARIRAFVSFVCANMDAIRVACASIVV
jgi:hypothetical protein